MKLLPTSELGKRRLARGLSLSIQTSTARPEKDEQELLDECPIQMGAKVLVLSGEHEDVEGVVRWRGVQRERVVLGLAVKGRDSGLVFVKAENCEVNNA